MLASITGFNKAGLKPTTTVVTTASGSQHTEQVTSQGIQATFAPSSSVGFIVSNQARGEEESSGEEQQRAVEFLSHLEPPTSEELTKRLRWQNDRRTLGDGLSVSPKSPVLRCGVFVLEKEPDEQHYDSFAFLLHDICAVRQIDHDDLVSGGLESLDVVIFPGGLIFDVERALGEDGAKHLSRFVYRGGGYFGVCAGGFLASADGYQGNDVSKKIISATANCISGVGKMHVKTSKDAADVFGPEFADCFIDLFWANGPIFTLANNTKNKILGKPIGKAKALGLAHSVQLGEAGEEIDMKGNMIGDVVALSCEFGEGRVVVFGAHPEASGIRFKTLISNSVLWCGKKSTL